MEGSKSTRLEQWKAMERQTGRKPAPLKNMPVLDEYLADIFTIYSKIASGVEYIRLVDINAYMDLYDDSLEHWQIEAILLLDKARAKAWQT